MFTKRKSIKQVEEGKDLAPRFDKSGLISVVTTDFKNGDVLMSVLGTTGMRIIQRSMGLILLVIAVQFVINGAVSVIRPLISPSL